jgi:hypothetical protein
MSDVINCQEMNEYLETVVKQGVWKYGIPETFEVKQIVMDAIDEDIETCRYIEKLFKRMRDRNANVRKMGYAAFMGFVIGKMYEKAIGKTL